MRIHKILAVSSSLLIVSQMIPAAFAFDSVTPGTQTGAVGLLSDTTAGSFKLGAALKQSAGVAASGYQCDTTSGSAFSQSNSCKSPASTPVLEASNPQPATAGTPLLSRACLLAAAPEPQPLRLAAADQPFSARVEATSIDTLDAQIVRKEIEFMKFNTDFRMHYAGGGMGKGRRLTAYNVAASATATAGLIDLQSQFYHYRSNPGLGLVHRGRLESGLILVMVGYLIEAGGYSFEALHDFYNDARSVGQHWDAKSVRTKAGQFRSEIDSLLAQRAQQLNAMDGDKTVLLAEGQVLSDWRDLAIVDFTQLYLQSRTGKHIRDIAEVATAGIAYSGAFPGALSAIQGVKHTNLKEVGGSGVGFMISAGLLTAAPWVIKLGAILEGNHSQKEVNREMGELKCHAAETLSKDLDNLHKVAMDAGVPTPLQKRLKVYDLCKDLVVRRCGMMDTEARIAKARFQEGVVSCLLRGGPQIAFSTMILHAGYADTTSATAAFRVVAQAATVDTVSWSIWLLDALQGGARAEISNVRNRKAESFSDNYPILKNMESFL